MKRPAPYAVDWDKSDWGRSWIILDAPEDAWPSKVQGSPELTAVGSDDWTVSRMDEPAFGAGWTLPRKAFRELADRAVWRRALDDQRFSLAEFAGQTRTFRTMYMAELVGRGTTFDEQAKALGEWSDQSIDDLLDTGVDPGPLEPPMSRGATVPR